jgi:hypothetical protein
MWRKTKKRTTTWLYLYVVILLSTIVYIRLCVYIRTLSNGLAYDQDYSKSNSKSNSYSSLADDGTPQTTPASPIPIPANETIAICLKIRDDNRILPEWLAYHYTMLPLRYLIVANDPHSQTSPLEVLERWKNHTDLQYTIWEDSDFLTNRMVETTRTMAENNNNKGSIINNATRTRQLLSFRENQFMYRCNRHFKTTMNNHPYFLNLSWVAHIDTDEFIAFNRITELEQDFWEASYEDVQDIPSKIFHNATWKKAMQLRNDLFLPEAAEEEEDTTATTTVYDVIQKLQRRRLLEYPSCLPMARWRHGSLDDMSCNNIQQPSTSIPSTSTATTTTTTSIDVSRLETFRYVQAAKPISMRSNLWGKAIVDVRQLSARHLRAVNAHRPSQACPSPDTAFMESVLVAYHYTGSWERYSFRQDARRSMDSWKERGNVNYTTSCDKQIQTWLPKFVQQVGSDSMAAYLLGHEHDHQYSSTAQSVFGRKKKETKVVEVDYS